MDERQRFRERTRTVLMSNRCQRIVLKLDTLTIDGGDYTYIALALLQRPDNVIGMDVRVEHQGGASAGLDPPGFGGPIAAFSIPPRPWYAGTYQEEIIIVHESTHACLEARQGFAIRDLTNEALAYVAEHIYNLIGGPGDETYDPATYQRPRITRQLNQIDRNVLLAADRVARMALAAGGVVTQAQLRAVEAAVAAHPVYSSLRVQPQLSSTGRGINLARTPALDPSVLHVLRH